MNCKNCDTPVKDKFCSHCGQAAKVSKLNLPNFLSEVSESLFQVNKGFFYTLVNLFKRPGQSIADFLDGKRKYYYKPVAYVLVLSTAYFLLSRVAEQNTLIEDLVLGFFNYNTDGGEELPAHLSWLFANYAYTTLLLLPVFSMASFLSFKRYKRNYLEHIVLNAYVTGQQAIFYSLFVALEIFIDNEFIEVISLFLSFFYTFWVFWHFFKDGNRVLNILSTLLTYVLYIFFSTGFLFLLAG